MHQDITVAEVQHLPWFQELSGLIEADINKAREAVQDDGPRLDAEIQKLKGSLRGWGMTLADPDLDPEVRALVQSDMKDASIRLRQCNADKTILENAVTGAIATLDPEDIVDRLNTLNRVLGGENATRTNVELARHIEAIRCYPDGRVVLRSCKFGAFYIEDLERNIVAKDIADATAEVQRRPKPRRRSARRLTCEDVGPELRAIADWATDVERFAGLDDDWFWEDEFQVPEAKFWSKEHAAEVARLRVEEGMTHDQLCEHFQVTPPTIRKALKLAIAANPTLTALPRKQPRARWEDSHYEEVQAMKEDKKMKVPDIARHFDVSDPLIYAALKLAKAKAAAHAGKHDTTVPL